MFRQPPLPSALMSSGWLAVALGVALLAAPAPVHGQDRSTQERLDRLERDLNMLQRQVYRGVPPPGMAAGDSGAAVNTEIRMNRVEEQMRALTGRIEEFANQVSQVRQRIEQLNGDVETRFSQGRGAGPLAAAEVAPARPGSAAARAARQFPPPPGDSVEEDAPPLRLAPSAALMPPGALPLPAGPLGNGPAPIFGTLTPPGTRAAPPPGETERRASVAATSPVGSGAPSGSSPAAQYNHAFGLLKQADYPGAEAALKDFVDENPKDPMAGNAQYWLGETFYARGHYLDAATAFAEGYKRYPKSTKAADGLLKLGMSLARANQKQNACVALGQLDRDFPHQGAAIKGRAEAEKKRLGC